MSRDDIAERQEVREKALTASLQGYKVEKCDCCERRWIKFSSAEQAASFVTFLQPMFDDNDITPNGMLLLGRPHG